MQGYKAKLADFGGSIKEGDRADTFAGSIRHSPKEICVQKQNNQPLTNYSKKTDIYMLGMIIFEILNFFEYKKSLRNGDIDKQRIFPQLKGQKDVINFILSNDNLPQYLISKLTKQEGKAREMKDIIELVRQCIEENPAKRPDTVQVIKGLKAIEKKQKTKITHVQTNWMKRISSHKTLCGKSGNTVSLYSGDELMSCLQKSIRRCANSECLFWLSEMALSGNYTSAMSRLTVIASEDLSLAHLQTPQFLLDNWVKFNEPGIPLFEQLYILFSTGDILASMRCCKTTNNSCGASLQFLENKITEVKEILKNKPDKVLTDNEIQYLEEPNEKHFQQIRELAFRARDQEDFNAEKEALCIIQRFYTEMENEDWHKAVWKEILSWETLNKHTKDNMNALYNLNYPGLVGGDSGVRLRIFHAFLLFTREKYFPLPLEPLPITTLSRDDVFNYLKNKLDNIKNGNIKENRLLTIYPFAVDRHTARGKGGPRDENYQYGVDTVPKFRAAAAIYGYDVSGWSEDEIAKSHGPAKKWPRNVDIGSPTLLEQFFDEGAVVFNTVYRQPPEITAANNGDCMYISTAKQFYIFWEKKYESVEAKSLSMMARHHKALRELQKYHQRKP